MSKYQLANAAIEEALARGKAEGFDSEDVLLALLVSTIAAYRTAAGSAATRDALLYELGEVDGTTDTQFIRSR